MNQTVVSFLLSQGHINVVQDLFVKLFGSFGVPLFTFMLFLVVIGVFIGILAAVGGLGTYAERKISADMQLRHGPNRVGPYGLLQFLADGIKMFLKEQIIPTAADPFLFNLAPLLCLAGVFGTIVVLPFSSGYTITDLNVGVFYLVAISSLVGLGVFLGGYASNSKWAMLGGMRGASQIISYEIPVTISILSIVLLSGGMSFGKIVGSQGGLPNDWYLFHNPFTFILFFIYFIGVLAETNRAPFDIPEAESELVSGYHTEYSGMMFGFFALAEYIEVFVVCGVAASLFLGGYRLPFDLGGNGPVGQALQLVTFFSKTFALYYVVIWIRWTLPRMRVDNLMTLCWKYLTPIAMVCLVGNAFWMYFFDGKSVYTLIFRSAAIVAGAHH